MRTSVAVLFAAALSLAANASAQEGKAVVQSLTVGIGREIEGGLELFDGLLLGGRIFVKGFAEIAVAPQPVFQLARIRKLGEKTQNGNGGDTHET